METAQGEEQTIENLTRWILDLGCELSGDSQVFDGESYLYLNIIPYTELIGGIPVIRSCPLLFGRRYPKIHWASSRRS